MGQSWTRKAHALFAEIDSQISKDGKITVAEFEQWAKANQKRATTIFPSVFEDDVFGLEPLVPDAGVVHAAVLMFFGHLLSSGGDKDFDGQLDLQEFTDVYIEQMVRNWKPITDDE